MPACAIMAENCQDLNISMDENDKSFIMLRENLKIIIKKYASNGVTDFYTNCEYGIPLLCAEIICGMKKRRKIRLNIKITYFINKSVDMYVCIWYYI